MFGYTQDDVAFYLACNQSMVSDWENDIDRPSRFYLSLLSVILDISEYGFILYCFMTEQEEKKFERKTKEIEKHWRECNPWQKKDSQKRETLKGF